MILRGLVCLLLLLFLPQAPGWARDVRLATRQFLPPYFMPDGKGGLEYDLIAAALAAEGHNVTFQAVPMARMERELQAGTIDGTVSLAPGGDLGLHFSQSHIIYRNFAITLDDDAPDLTELRDLTVLPVLAFQNATILMGNDYRAMAQANPFYREEGNQALQAVSLFMKRTKVVVSDVYVFCWFADSPEVSTKVNAKQPLRFYALFPPTPHYVAFRDASLRDSFDKGLKKLRDNGIYAKITERYSGDLKARGAPLP